MVFEHSANGDTGGLLVKMNGSVPPPGVSFTCVVPLFSLIVGVARCSEVSGTSNMFGAYDVWIFRLIHNTKTFEYTVV